MRTLATTAMTVVGALLAACGGGGGNPGGKANLTPAGSTPTPSQQVADFVGTWVADCAGRTQETDVITQVSAGTLSIAQQTDYYSGTGCTGFVIATQTQSSPVTATFTGTATATVALPPSSTATPVTVALLSGTVSPYTVSFTGTGVTRTTTGGQPSWCVNYGANDQQCFADEGLRPASTTTTALYVSGNQLYELTPSGSTYTVTQRLTKR